MEKHFTPKPEKIIQFNESAIQGRLSEMVRHNVEETLNQMLEAEADRLCQADKYQRSEARKDTRAGFYQRKLHTKAGEVTLNMPKLRQQTFETAIIERYRRREASVEEALIEMYLAGVSVRRVEDITEALWGTKVSPGTISKLNQEVYKSIEAWRSQLIPEPFLYVYLDGVVLKRSWAGEVSNVSVLVAIGVNASGYRKILGVAEGAKEDKAGWSSFLRHLKERGLTGVRLFTTDACLGLVESLGDFFPEVKWQRCTVHFYRNEIRRRTRVVGAFPDGQSALMLCAAKKKRKIICTTEFRQVILISCWKLSQKCSLAMMLLQKIQEERSAPPNQIGTRGNTCILQTSDSALLSTLLPASNIHARSV